jgi:hypothetical protein
MYKLNVEQRTRILAALVDGCSVSATAHMTGNSKVTILCLLETVGAACQAYHE